MTDGVAIAPFVSSALGIPEGNLAPGAKPRPGVITAKGDAAGTAEGASRNPLGDGYPLGASTAPTSFEDALSHALHQAADPTAQGHDAQGMPSEGMPVGENLPQGMGAFGISLPLTGNGLPMSALGSPETLGTTRSAGSLPVALLHANGLHMGDPAHSFSSTGLSTLGGAGTLATQAARGQVGDPNLQQGVTNETSTDSMADALAGGDPELSLQPASRIPPLSTPGVVSTDLPLNPVAAQAVQANLLRAQNDARGLTTAALSAEHTTKVGLRSEVQLAAAQDQLAISQAQQLAQADLVESGGHDLLELAARLSEMDTARSQQRVNWAPLGIESASAAIPNQLAASLLPITSGGDPLAPTNLSLSSEPRQAQEQLAQGFAQLVRKGEQTLDIQLSPANLGTIQARIVMQGDQAQLWLVVPNAEVRELFEQSMPRLADLLKDAGLTLGDTSVANAEEQSQQASDGQNHNGAAGSEQSARQGADSGSTTPTLSQSKLGTAQADLLETARGYAAAGLMGTGSIDAYA